MLLVSKHFSAGNERAVASGLGIVINPAADALTVRLSGCRPTLAVQRAAGAALQRRPGEDRAAGAVLSALICQRRLRGGRHSSAPGGPPIPPAAGPTALWSA
jgi:hypothetical protein